MGQRKGGWAALVSAIASYFYARALNHKHRMVMREIARETDLWALMDDYLSHKPGCPLWSVSPEVRERGCKCGFDQVRRQITQLHLLTEDRMKPYWYKDAHYGNEDSGS